MSKSDNRTRFYIYAIALLPYILLLVTGVIMLKYHTGTPPESKILGLGGYAWMSFHKVAAVVTIPLIILHLFIKTNWVKNLFQLKAKGRFKAANIMLFVAFTLCTLTAIGAWLIFNNPKISSMLGGIHNKLGLLLILVSCIHIWNYRKVIIKQFQHS